MTRKEHLAWCKQRALEYLDRGDVANAIASMTSDLQKHPGTVGMPSVLIMMGYKAVKDRDLGAARYWIEGFN
jgi:outer membrane protein assembly factor BamD (BamD/ComL family)